MVTLMYTSTLSGTIVKTFRSDEGLPKMYYLGASSLEHLRGYLSRVPLLLVVKAEAVELQSTPLGHQTFAKDCKCVLFMGA